MSVKFFKKSFVVSFVAAVLAVGFAAGCGSPSPSSVVSKFHEALLKSDMETIGKLSTPETMAAVAAFSGKIVPHAKGLGKIKSMKEAINGDTAVVTATYANGETDDYNLVKVDGKWKVNMDSSSGK